MMEELGTVVECSGGKAVVRIERSAACEGCTLCTLAESGDAMLASAVDRVGVSVGDRVRMQTRSPSPLAATLLLFVVPFASLFAGYGVGALIASVAHVMTATQPLGAGCALLFFIGSFGLLSALTRGNRGAGAGAPQSVIVEKLPA
jgi:sigma-E factor negative regulatory protein RseC